MIIGLTGKSCAGKDEVASILSSFGYYVIDEDKLGHEALRANRDSLISEFGEGILSDGEVDRKKLGSIVFSDPMKLKKLEVECLQSMDSQVRTLTAVLPDNPYSALSSMPHFLSGQRGRS